MHKKILIADDDPISLATLKKTLSEAGFSSALAQDGRKAWEMLSQNPQEFVLVIADRMMPHLHGMDLLLKMRQHPQLLNIPLAIITGEAEKQEVIAALQAGVFDFLYKPLDKDVLVAMVKKAISGS
jgi:two-component system, chemotaxis family, chemotaxis protein CheY